MSVYFSVCTTSFLCTEYVQGSDPALAPYPSFGFPTAIERMGTQKSRHTHTHPRGDAPLGFATHNRPRLQGSEIKIQVSPPNPPSLTGAPMFNDLPSWGWPAVSDLIVDRIWTALRNQTIPTVVSAPLVYRRTYVDSVDIEVLATFTGAVRSLVGP